MGVGGNAIFSRVVANSTEDLASNVMFLTAVGQCFTSVGPENFAVLQKAVLNKYSNRFEDLMNSKNFIN